MSGQISLRLKFLTCVVVASTALQGNVFAGERTAAIFIQNRAGPALNDKVLVMEDFLTGRLTDAGFSIISRESAIDSIAPSELDEIFSKESSALRLAQNLGADYLFFATISSLGTEKKSFDNYGIKTVNVIHTLRVSYRVLDASRAGSIVGETVKASKTTQITADGSSENSDVVNELLDEAASMVAASFTRKIPAIRDPAAKPSLVTVTVLCGMQDLVQMPVSVPDVRIADDGTVVMSTNQLAVQVLDATVEINGTAIGSAPGIFKVPPGLNKMKITREGFKDWERTVAFTEGQKFNVALQMSEAGYARWKDTTAFLFALKTGEKLTDGTVKMMEGFAQTLRQSGFRVDSKTDVNVKANIEAKGKSLFDGATLKLLGD